MVDLTFGRLTIIEDLGSFVKEGTKNKRHYVKCICSCSNKTEIIVDLAKLKNGHTTSCGCKAREHIIKLNIEDNPSKYYIRKLNEHWVDECGVAHIKMSNTENEMLCDIEDLDVLLKYYWNENEYGYARTTCDKKCIFAHRIIMNLDMYKKNEQVDHINGNRLDNRQGNLIIATSSQQNMNTRVRVDNTSGYRGVCFNKKMKKWCARIYENNIVHHLGYFNTKEEAAKAYEEAAIKYHGEFRRAA